MLSGCGVCAGCTSPAGVFFGVCIFAYSLPRETPIRALNYEGAHTNTLFIGPEKRSGCRLHAWVRANKGVVLFLFILVTFRSEMR